MLTLSTSPELETLLQNEAQKMGLSAEQLVLNYIAEKLPQTKPTRSDEEFEAALDELVGCTEGAGFGTTEWRAMKEEEMALEEEKHERRFGKGRTS